RARVTYITQVLNGSRLVRQKVGQVIEDVRCSALPIRIETVEPDFASELDIVFTLRPTEIVQEVQRIRCVWLTPAIRGGVGSDKAAGIRGACRSSLSGNAEVGGTSGEVDREFTEVNAIHDRRQAVC